MANYKSQETVLGELRAFILAYNRQIDTGDTSLTKDFILTPQSVGGALVFAQIETVNNQFILSNQTSEQLDEEGTNYTLERSLGSFATVTVVFYSATAPTAAISISAGTQATTAGTSLVSPVSFATIADYTAAVSSFGNFYSYDRGRYEFPVDCKAQVIGKDSNVGSETIVKLASPVTGISGVANLIASSGGQDAESDEDYRTRIQTAKTGRDLNTRNGLRTFVNKQGFTDSYAVRVEDADSERPEGVDVFVIATYSVAISEVFTYRSNLSRYYFTNAPVTNVTSVISAVSGTIASTDYDVHIDNTTQYRRSSFAQDYIEIRNSASLANGSQFTVTYTYSADVAQTQDTFAVEKNDILTSTIVIKRAFPLYFYMTATLTLKANADGPATRNRVRNALLQFFATYRMGQEIQKSDIVVVCQEGYGDFAVDSVDAVVISSYYLDDLAGTIYLPVTETITINNKQYAVYGQATIL